ncbi:MAG: hypothetical protein CL780_01180 [Chloroflexi bacterium]|nr:hypothetical protein [Chloroflexota bacterium]|tara:strand:- start:118 stop:861 length:744 start_codon:yes stop_codon:yes gene_type:complete
MDKWKKLMFIIFLMKQMNRNKYYLRYADDNDLNILESIQEKNVVNLDFPNIHDEFSKNSTILIVSKKWSITEKKLGLRNLRDVSFQNNKKKLFPQKILHKILDIVIKVNPPIDFIIGFVVLRKIFSDFHIMMLVVREDERKKGVGELLIIGAIDEALGKDLNTITLEVGDSNFRAQKLYKNYGFIKTGLRKKYYKNEDALIFSTPNIKMKSYRDKLTLNLKKYLLTHSNNYNKRSNRISKVLKVLKG